MYVVFVPWSIQNGILTLSKGWLLFHISSGQNNLECLLFPTDSTLTPINCDIFEKLDTLNISLSENSWLLSVQLIPTPIETAFLLVYHDLTERTNVLYFHRSKGATQSYQWHWHNVTEVVKLDIRGYSNRDVLETCIPSVSTDTSIGLICIAKFHNEKTSSLFSFGFQISRPGHFTSYCGRCPFTSWKMNAGCMYKRPTSPL